MRLPWPFRQARSDGGTADPIGSGAAGAGDAAPWTGSSPSRGAWRSLPPLAETIADPPLIAPVKPFRADLASATPPPPILPPLRHGRGLEAPQGLVVGLARPTAAGASNAPTAAPVQRAPLRPTARAAALELEPAAPDRGAAPDGEVVEPAGAASSGEPIRHLPISASSASGPRLDLTRAALDLRAPSGVVRHPGPAATPTVMGAAAIQRAPEATAPPPQPDRGGDHAPIRAAASAVQRAPNAAGQAPGGEAGRLSIGQARRLGLGAPISSGPMASARSSASSAPALVPQRAAALTTASLGAGDGAAAGSLRLPARSDPSSLPRHPTPSEPGSIATGAPAAGAAAARSSAARPPALEPAVAAPSSRELDATTPGSIDRVQRAPGRPASVVVTSAPLRSQIQRAPLVLEQSPSGAADGKPSASGASTSLPSVSGSITVHRGPDATDLSSAMEARSFTHRGEIYLPSSHGPLSSGPARSLLAHEMTHVEQQRRLGSSLPHESSRSGQALEAEAVQAERGSSLPLATSAKGVTDRAPGSTPQPQRAAEPPAPPPAAASSSDTTTVHVASDVQRAPAGPVSGAKSSTPVPGASGRSKPTERELDDLARQLYARIGRRLQRDLLVDRERAGMAVDLS